MLNVESQAEVRSAPLLPLTATLGEVVLAVTDRDRALAIWRDVVGLDIVSEQGARIGLGVDGKVLITLEVTAARPVVKQTIGLYHVAIHVPTRADLAQFAVRAMQRRVGIAPTDHLVSEAIYAWDTDGNGIEITFETPWRGTLGDADTGSYGVTTDGKPHSGREPIDMDGLLAELGDNPALAPRMPAGTRIGHVHVHVRDLDESMRFYRDGLGFGGLFIIRSFGMGDVGLDYMPHTLAFNVWSGGRYAANPPEDAAGLRWFTIVVPDQATLAAMRRRLATVGARVAEVEGGIETRDPSGNRMKVVVG